MAASAVGAGDGMHRQRFTGCIHCMQISQRRVQPVEAAQIEHAVRLAHAGRD